MADGVVVGEREVVQAGVPAVGHDLIDGVLAVAVLAVGVQVAAVPAPARGRSNIRAAVSRGGDER